MRFLPLALVVVALTGFMACGENGHTLTAELEWHPYFKGLDLGKAEKKNMVVNFYADWCGYCKKMDDVTYADKEVAAYLKKHFVLMKVNTDRAKQLAQSYSVQGLPTTWFLDQSGEKIAPLPGFAPPEQFLPILKFIQTNAYKSMSFKEFTEKGLHEKS